MLYNDYQNVHEKLLTPGGNYFPTSPQRVTVYLELRFFPSVRRYSCGVDHNIRFPVLEDANDQHIE